MINIITDSYYYKNIPDNVSYNAIHCPLEFSTVDNDIRPKFDKILIEFSYNMYIKTENFFLAYDDTLGYVLIPDIYDVSEVRKEIEKDNTVRFNNWSLERTSEKVKSIMNEFLLPTGRFKAIDYNPEGTYADFTGCWKLTDSISKEVLEFELKYDPSLWSCYCFENSTELLISYEERQQFPLDTNLIYKQDNYLELLFNGCKNNQRVNFKSKSNS